MAQRKNTKTEALKASTAIEVVSQSDIPIAEVVLTPEQEKELADCAERLVALGRRTTAQTYEYGEQLSKAQALLPPKKFGQWLDAHCGIKTKTAKNYTRVFHELAAYRVRLEKAAAAPAAMFALLGATDDAIENVLAVYEDGKRPTVAQIKEMVSGAGKLETPEVNVLDMPGRAGCLKVAEQRLKSNIALFYDLLSKILEAIEVAAQKFDAGVRVIKSDLVVAVELDARHAHDLFSLTLAPVFVHSRDDWANWRSTSYGQDSAWGRLQRVLSNMGGKDSWPTGPAFKAWIVDDAYPLLKFAVRGEALPSSGEMDNSVITLNISPEAEAIQAADEAKADKATRRSPVATPANGNVVALASRRQAGGADNANG